MDGTGDPGMEVTKRVVKAMAMLQKLYKFLVEGTTGGDDVGCGELPAACAIGQDFLAVV